MKDVDAMTSMNRSNEHGPSGTVTRSIDEELEALGEAPRSARERALVSEASTAEDDARAVRSWLGLGEPASSPLGDAPLGELEQRRVWRAVARRSHAASAPRRPSAAPSWLWLTVAVAASVLLVALWKPNAPQPNASREVSKALGAQARRAVDGLQVPRDEARARALAQAYAEQLRGSPASGGQG